MKKIILIIMLGILSTLCQAQSDLYLIFDVNTPRVIQDAKKSYRKCDPNDTPINILTHLGMVDSRTYFFGYAWLRGTNLTLETVKP